ncbi:MAG: ABC transporter ATP-binding protein [Actinomycetota bacterium]|nr:ABC transporter ATP-binding protein [Actinomycetota bacterium]
MSARVVVSGASKRYVKYVDTPLLVSRARRPRSTHGREELWALRDLDFEIGRGECVGVIGRNGSGKSTLLRLLAGVTAPTTGRVAVTGLIAPLISVGVGFHPELSGRENVYINGIILGLTQAEIDERFDEVVEFAEIGDFLDTPVKFYSSGMFVRLGFSVSILADPDVLLIDEVLAVGDLAFGLKCLDRMQELRDAGTTIVLVSHNLHSIRLMCDRTLLLHGGEVRHDGDTSEAISLFHDLLGEARDIEGPGLRDHGAFSSVDEAGAVEHMRIVDADGRPTGHVRAGDPIAVELDVRFARTVDNVIVGLNVHNQSGFEVLSDSTPWRAPKAFAAGDRIRFTARVDTRLATGTYTIQLSIFTPEGVFLTRSVAPLPFFVEGRDQVSGIADLGASFDTVALEPDAASDA